MLETPCLSTEITHIQSSQISSCFEEYDYLAFGLSIRSSIYFPELPCLETKIEHPDVTIRYTDSFEANLEEPLFSARHWQAKHDALRLDIPGVALFFITQGRTITVAPYPSSDLASIRLFILGSCIGALLMQRDYFVLHGNAIQIGQACISIVGDSGAGKSTLCAAFFKRGYSILADDVCAVHPNLEVTPSFPQIKLWKDSAAYLGIDTAHLRRIRPNTEKFALPLQTQYQTNPLPLRGIYQLTPSEQPQQKQEVSGLQKLTLLHRNIYRRQYLRGLGKANLHQELSAKIAGQIFAMEILRPRGEFQLETLVDFIEQDLREKGVL